jgi:predicted nucleotidyltransferase
MNLANRSHQEMLFTLLDNDVDFIVVGGYAVIYHGYIRTTGDMDLWLRPTDENKVKLLEVFKRLEFDPEGIEKLAGLDFASIAVFHIGEEPERIDFLTHLQGLNFDEALSRKMIMEIKGYQVPFLHLNDLITNKLLANRLKDRADVENLQKMTRRKD